METVGIVGEYNPFHSGHAYHLAKTREALGGECAVVCALSGDYVQRGEAATYAKYARAEAACRCGVDLVLELPLPWALSSAEGFARGAVGLLDSIGQCGYLSFGSECGDIGLIEEAAMVRNHPAGKMKKQYLGENAGKYTDLKPISPTPDRITQLGIARTFQNIRLWKSMSILRSRLFEAERAKRDAAVAAERKSQIGTGDRSDRIRTYNFPQNRVTDHRLTGEGRSFNIDTVINGGLDPLIDALAAQEQTEKLKEQSI